MKHLTVELEWQLAAQGAVRTTMGPMLHGHQQSGMSKEASNQF